MTGPRPNARARHRRLGAAFRALGVVFGSAVGAFTSSLAMASERLDNRVAVFSALDKVTATIKTLEIPINETVQFGALKVTPRVCYSRPPTEQPKTTTFVEVDEVQLDGNQKRIFSGWMFAESPGLNALEHPVFDLWLTDCTNPARTAASPRAPAAGQAAPQGESEPTFRRRVRR
jgi:hypothetical protein